MNKPKRIGERFLRHSIFTLYHKTLVCLTSKLLRHTNSLSLKWCMPSLFIFPQVNNEINIYNERKAVIRQRQKLYYTRTHPYDQTQNP